MARPLLQLAALGLAGFAAWKLASIFFLPLFFWALKIAFLVGLVLFVVWLFRKRGEDKEGNVPPSA